MEHFILKIAKKCCEILDIPPEVQINIEIFPIIDEYGNVLGDGYAAQNNDISYDIVIHDEVEGKELEDTIKHEMKHIQQMVQGRLLIDEVNEEMDWGFWWEGVFYKENETYYDAPWEIEAREFEKYPLELD